jgi:hypothetical protein
VPKGHRRAGHSTRPSCRSVRAEPSGKSALGRRAALALRSCTHGDVHAAISYAKARSTPMRWMHEGAIDPPELGFVLLMRDRSSAPLFELKSEHVQVRRGNASERASEGGRVAARPRARVIARAGRWGWTERLSSELERVWASACCQCLLPVSAAEFACWCGRGRCHSFESRPPFTGRVVFRTSRPSGARDPAHATHCGGRAQAVGLRGRGQLHARVRGRDRQPAQVRPARI